VVPNAVVPNAAVPNAPLRPASDRWAVLTGDVVASGALPERAALPGALGEAFDALAQKGALERRFELFRGDSFQGVVHPGEALHAAVLIRARMRGLESQGGGLDQRPDARIAIGIGALEFAAATVGASDGEAARLSGRALDRLGRDRDGARLAVDTLDDTLRTDLDLIVRFTDSLVTRWRAPGAEVAFLALAAPEMTQEEVAARLGVTQSAVSQRRKSAAVDTVLELVQRFRDRVAAER